MSAIEIILFVIGAIIIFSIFFFTFLHSEKEEDVEKDEICRNHRKWR